MTCATCKFAQPRAADKDDKQLVCQRYPPQILTAPFSLNWTSTFPPVSGTRWCGEYQEDKSRSPWTCDRCFTSNPRSQSQCRRCYRERRW